MELILAGIFITCMILFALSVVVGLISLRLGLNEEIEAWCIVIGISSITLAFTIGLIGAFLFGGKENG